MKHRSLGLILFALIWLVVLCVPPLRLILQVQIFGSDLMQSLTDEMPETPFYQRLAARYPNDVRVLAKALVNETNFYEPNFEKKTEITQRYNALIRRFPDRTWLVASAVRWTSNWLEDGRPVPPVEGDYGPGAEPKPKKQNFTSAELAQAIALTRRGQRLEPDNSFYDWILAQFLFAGHQDQAALNALHAGARKPHYDDHLRDDARILQQVRELVRPLLTEERLRLSGGSSMYYFRMRHIAQVAVALAIRAERSGDHQRALQIYSDLIRLGGTLLHDTASNEYYFYSTWLPITIQKMAWEGASRKLPPPEFGRTPDRPYSSQAAAQADESARIVLRAKNFAAYATTHGRPDLAKESLHAGEATANLWKRSQRLFDPDTAFGVPTRTFWKIATLWWLSGTLLTQLLVTLPVWLVLWLALRRERSTGEPVRWMDALKSNLLCVVAVGVLISTLFYFGVISPSNWPAWMMSQGEEADAIRDRNVNIFHWLIAVAPVLFGLIYCLFATACREVEKSVAEQRQAGLLKSQSPYLRWAPIVALVLSWLIYWFCYQTQPMNYEWMIWTNLLAIALFLFSVLSWLMRFSQWRHSISVAYGLEKPMQTPLNMAPLDAGDTAFWRRDFFPHLRQSQPTVNMPVSDAIAIVLTVFSWLVCLLGTMTIRPSSVPIWWFVSYVAAVLLTLFHIVFWIMKIVRWLRAVSRTQQARTQGHSDVLRHSLRWYQRTLGVMLVLSSLAYLLLSLASLTLRRQADEKLDRLIQQSAAEGKIAQNDEPGA